MFFPEDMSEAKIKIEKEHLEEELSRIGNSSLLHIDTSNTNLFFANLQHRSHSLLNRIQKYMDTLEIAHRDIYKEEIEEFEDEIESIEEFLKDVGSVVEKISNEQDRVEKLSQRLKVASKVSSCFKDLKIDEVMAVKEMKVRVVLIPENLFDSLEISLEKQRVLVVSGFFSKDSRAVALFFPEEKKEIVERTIAKLEAQIIENRYFTQEESEKLQKRKDLLKISKEEAKERFEDELIHMESRLNYMYKMLFARTSLVKEEEHYILRGWIPSKKRKHFKKVQKYSKADFKDGKKDAPVLLKTPKLFQPFEDLIENYSYPSYTELNPTVLFAFTFLLMFGMMFGDIGHGATLSALGYLVLRRNKGLKVFGEILVSTGISAMLFGVLYGSFFGFHHVIPHLLFHPMDDINHILVMSLFVGIIIITLSMVLNIFSKIREKDYNLMIFGASGILWLLVYWFIIGVVVKITLFNLSVTTELYIIGAMLATLFIMFLYRTKDFIKSVLEMVMETMEYATNTVSFIRLGAFTLSHAALFFALFAIADIISSSQNSGLGYWITIILGNIFIIVLEGVVVSIQTLRLEYYEFFKRFYRGGGVKYKPFDLKEKV